MKKLFALISVVAMVLMSSMCFGFNFDEWMFSADREGRLEVFGAYAGYDKDDFDIGSVDIEAYSFGQFGGGVGYNINNHFNIYVDAMHASSVDYRASSTMGERPVYIKDDIRLTSGSLNMDINLSPSRICPVISGGIGFADFSDGINTELLYNFGMGIRVDFTKNLFMKTMYRHTWIDGGDIDMETGGLHLTIGWVF